MTRQLHPITTTALQALHANPDGMLALDARGVEAIRRAVEATMPSGDLGECLTALVELAYVVESKAVASELRALASEFVGPLRGEIDRRSEQKRQRRIRFARFSGFETAPCSSAPVKVGALKVSDLRPPQLITGR